MMRADRRDLALPPHDELAAVRRRQSIELVKVAASALIDAVSAFVAALEECSLDTPSAPQSLKEERLLKRPEAMKRLGVGRETLNALIKRGELRIRRVQGTGANAMIFIPESAIVEFTSRRAS